MKRRNLIGFVLAGLLAFSPTLLADGPKKPQTPFEALKAQVDELLAKIQSLETRIADLEAENQALRKAAGLQDERVYEVWGTGRSTVKVEPHRIKASSPAEALAKARSVGIERPAGTQDEAFNQSGDKVYPTVCVPGDTASKRFHDRFDSNP